MDVAAFDILLAELGREEGCTFRDIQWGTRITKTDKEGLVIYNANFRGIPIVVKMMMYMEDTPMVQAFFMERRMYMEVINNILLDGQCGNLVPAVSTRLCFSNCYKRFGLPFDTRVAALITVVPPGFLGDSVTTLLRKSPDLQQDTQYMKRLLFQMLYTLQACHENGVTHNDNHLGNWLVGTAADSTAQLRYIVSPTHMYVMPGDFCVYLFDWDRSFTDDLGNNGLLSDAQCRKLGECNKHRPQRDVFLTLCQLSDALGTLCNMNTPLGGVLHEVMRHVETAQLLKCAARRDEQTRKTVCRVLPSDNLEQWLPDTLDLLRDPFFDDLLTEVPADLDLDDFTYVLPHVQAMEQEDDTLPVQLSPAANLDTLPVQAASAQATLPVQAASAQAAGLGSDFEKRLTSISSSFLGLPKI
jgi:hypothetical protein